MKRLSIFFWDLLGLMERLVVLNMCANIGMVGGKLIMTIFRTYQNDKGYRFQVFFIEDFFRFHFCDIHHQKRNV